MHATAKRHSGSGGRPGAYTIRLQNQVTDFGAHSSLRRQPGTKHARTNKRDSRWVTARIGRLTAAGRRLSRASRCRTKAATLVFQTVLITARRLHGTMGSCGNSTDDNPMELEMSRTAKDDRSDSMNPNSDSVDDSRDNRFNQFNPNNDRSQANADSVYQQKTRALYERRGFRCSVVLCHSIIWCREPESNRHAVSSAGF